MDISLLTFFSDFVWLRGLSRESEKNILRVLNNWECTHDFCMFGRGVVLSQVG